jgi:hypothetical protein
MSAEPATSRRSGGPLGVVDVNAASGGAAHAAA